MHTKGKLVEFFFTKMTGTLISNPRAQTNGWSTDKSSGQNGDLTSQNLPLPVMLTLIVTFYFWLIDLIHFYDIA